MTLPKKPLPPTIAPSHSLKSPPSNTPDLTPKPHIVHCALSSTQPSNINVVNAAVVSPLQICLTEPSDFHGLGGQRNRRHTNQPLDHLAKPKHSESLIQTHSQQKIVCVDGGDGSSQPMGFGNACIEVIVGEGLLAAPVPMGCGCGTSVLRACFVGDGSGDDRLWLVWGDGMA